MAGEFPAQMASNAENVSIWWRDHDIYHVLLQCSSGDTWQVLMLFYGCNLYFGMNKNSLTDKDNLMNGTLVNPNSRTWVIDGILSCSEI